MTQSAAANPKVLRAQMYKAFIDLAEAEAALKQAERDEVRLERPVIREEHNMTSEGVESCTAQEYVEQFQKQLDVMAKAFPEKGEAFRNAFDELGPATMAGKLGKFIAEEEGRVKTLWDAKWDREFEMNLREEAYREAGEVIYNHVLDLKVSELPEEDRARVLDDLKMGGALHKRLSESDDIPEFYVLPDGLIAYNEGLYEEGAPVLDLVIEHLEAAGIETKQFRGLQDDDYQPFACDIRLITIDGVFPAPGTATDPNPEKWLPELKAQVLDLYAPQSKDHDAMIEPG